MILKFSTMYLENMLFLFSRKRSVDRMKITSVTVKKIDKENSRMKGIASVLIDDCFAVHDIRIIEAYEKAE